MNRVAPPTKSRLDRPTGMLKSIRFSLRRKLMVVVLSTSFLALLLMGSTMLVYELRTYQQASVNDMVTQADLLGRASAPALTFDDDKVARENLALLRLRPQVIAAALYTVNGKLFASYRRDASAGAVPPAPEAGGHRVEGGELILFRQIWNNRELVGTIYFRAEYELVQRLLSYLTIVAAVMLASMLVAVLLTSWMQKAITRPILGMAGVARQVMARRDYSLKATKTTDDEIGYLVEAFNAMLAEIGGRTEALEASNRTLEQEMGVRRRAEAALLAADRQKDQFLATLAHELRNPLAPLLNALDVLRLPGTDAQARQATHEMMERQLRQLVQLVNDLLDVSRITTGKMVLKRERCELADIAHMALEAAAPLLQARQHRLTLDLPPQPVHLMADPTRLVQVFLNLLNNAAKFTDAGGQIHFVARAEGNQVRVTVQDNGMGIAPAVLPLIFGMFAQADRSLERVHAGLGVGLSLAKFIVELHHGEIAAHSDGPGSGSRFTVTLPMLATATAAPAPAPPAPAAPVRDTAAGLRVLLADDNVDFAASLALLLEADGHQVRVTHDGHQALQAAPSFQPEVCFLDIGLPKLHGYELAARLRGLPGLKNVYLVAVSGWGQPEDKLRARDAGFNRHLVKPVEYAQVLEVVEALRADPSTGP
jgi:signal transduction histidine kinase/ActR/RegA family two-component response regulator